LTSDIWNDYGSLSSGCVKLPFLAAGSNYQVEGQCLQRSPDTGYALEPPETVNRLITSNGDYRSFSQKLEGNVHAGPHNLVGGVMSTMKSPADPLFWAHHTFVDRVWSQWQDQSDSNKKAYGASMSDQLVGLGITVGDVMDIRAKCYTYSDLPATKVEPKPLPPPTIDSTPVGGASSSSTVNVPASIPQGFTFTPSPTAQRTTPPPDDKTSVTGLRQPKPLSDNWIKMNNLNSTAVHEQEDDSKQTIDKLNALKGYISPAALYFRPEMWKRMASMTDKFVITIPGMGEVSMPSNSSSDISQMISNFRAFAQNYAPNFYTNPQQIASDLKSICGNPVGGNNSAGNFLNVPVFGKSVDNSTNSTTTSIAMRTDGMNSFALLTALGAVLYLA